MKATHFFSLFIFIAVMASCKSTGHMGERVREPFTGSKYESNNRFFRATGKGVSGSDNIARGRADMQAKTQLAGQVETNMRNVTDQYMTQTENLDAADVGEKFQSLSRQVINTNMSDLRKIGEEKYYNGSEYTVFIAYEIRKNAMFRFMKKQARAEAEKANSQIDSATLRAIEEILDAQIAASEGDD